MAAQQAMLGQCFFCKGTFSKRGIAQHLRACPERHKAIAAEKGRKRRLFHIKVEDAYSPLYWLHIEIGATDTLEDLDDFLRVIWLECCGHLSHFVIGNVYYERVLVDSGMGLWQERSMNVRLQDVLEVGDSVKYEYDYGTTSELVVTVVGERQGVLRRGDVRVLARNFKPVLPCTVCGKPAAWMDTYEFPPAPYCDEHAQEHEYWEEAFLPLVNSPRTGMCAYVGPEEEEYQFEVLPPQG